MKNITLLIYTALAALLLVSGMVFPAFAVTVPTFTLSFSSTQLKFMLPTETMFNGSIVTTGTVRFWVSAPNGAQIVNLGLIDKTTTFSFIAPQNGNYTLNFENDLPNPIQVTFSYVTNPDLSGNNNSTGISQSYVLIPVIIAILG